MCGQGKAKAEKKVTSELEKLPHYLFCKTFNYAKGRSTNKTVHVCYYLAHAVFSEQHTAKIVTKILLIFIIFILLKRFIKYIFIKQLISVQLFLFYYFDWLSGITKVFISPVTTPSISRQSFFEGDKAFDFFFFNANQMKIKRKKGCQILPEVPLTGLCK